MVFRHISANRLSFLLTSDGVPSGLLVNGENIPIGSLAIDRVSAKLYILKPNLSWSEIAGGFGTSGGNSPVPSQLYEELIAAGTSAPYTYHLGFMPAAGSVKLFVNGQLTIPSPLTNFHYTLSGQTITWSLTAPFAVDPTDQFIVYYDTFAF